MPTDYNHFKKIIAQMGITEARIAKSIDLPVGTIRNIVGSVCAARQMLKVRNCASIEAFCCEIIQAAQNIDTIQDCSSHMKKYDYNNDFNDATEYYLEHQ